MKARNPGNTVAATNFGGYIRLLKVIRRSNSGFVVATVYPGFLAFV